MVQTRRCPGAANSGASAKQTGEVYATVHPGADK